MKILVFGNTYKREFPNQVKVLFDRLIEGGAELSFEREFGEMLANLWGIDTKTIEMFDKPESGDIALSFGGDGTLLRTAGKIGAMETPILGINFGHLGFLADVNSNALDNLDKILLKKDFVTDDRIVLKTTSSDGRVFYSLNELTVHKQDISSMINIETKLNGEDLNTYHADGLIIATPTGSTAYSLSVGGPILMPDSHNLIIAPAASHSLNDRPLVIPDDFVIELKTSSRSGRYMVSCDGDSCMMNCKIGLKVERAPFNVHIIRMKGHSFFKTLKERLYWGMDKRF